MKKINVVTKTGDCGETSLWIGGRVKKTDTRIIANSQIDMLQVALGFCKRYTKQETIINFLENVQTTLFSLMSEIACDKKVRKKCFISNNDLILLDSACNEIQNYINENGGLHGWSLAGDKDSLVYDNARVLCRQAEISVLLIHEDNSIKIKPRKICNIYLNRLSDLLFLIGRYQEFIKK